MEEKRITGNDTATFEAWLRAQEKGGGDDSKLRAVAATLQRLQAVIPAK